MDLWVGSTFVLCFGFAVILWFVYDVFVFEIVVLLLFFFGSKLWYCCCVGLMFWLWVCDCLKLWFEIGGCTMFLVIMERNISLGFVDFALKNFLSHFDSQNVF